MTGDGGEWWRVLRLYTEMDDQEDNQDEDEHADNVDSSKQEELPEEPHCVWWSLVWIIGSRGGAIIRGGGGGCH